MEQKIRLTLYRRIAGIFIALLAIVSVVAAENPSQQKAEKYEKSWNAVDSLVKHGLTKSALDTVELIYKAALTASNADQTIKSVIYRMRLSAVREENSFVKTMERLAGEIKNAAFPIAPVLHSMLAECYLHYYQNNRWRFLGRTQTRQFDAADIKTWDLRTILEKTIAEYELSLKDAAELKKVQLDIYDEAIADSESDAKLRPTLYDFLAHRAVDFFSMDDIELIKPAFEFTLNSEDYFKPFERFAHLKLSSEDTGSAKLHALRILQDLIVFHANGNDLEALIDADLKRLSFVRRHSLLPNKDSLYLKALQTLEKIAPYSPSSAEVTYAIGSLYHEWAETYVPRKDERYRWMNKEAVSVCERAMKTFAGSFGGRQCAALAGWIKAQDVSFTNEYAAVPGKPFKALLSYKNLSHVYWRLIAMGIDDYQRLIDSTDNDSVAVAFLKYKPLKEWDTEVPEPGDHQRHAVEIEMPAMPFGHYVILCASDPQFRREHEVIALNTTQISRMSSIERRQKNGDLELYVLDRETGVPMKGVKAKVWTHVYHAKEGRYKKALKETYTADREGRLCMTGLKKKYSSCFIELVNDNDRFFPGQEFYLYRMGKPPKSKSLRTFFFTDRAMYRPGQIVYFKGIMLRTDGDRHEVADKEKAIVKFLNVNQQEVGRLSLTTNGYGSFHGSFTTPKNALNGQMHISDGHGEVYFSVEDYKRPRFLVLPDTFKGTYRLGDTVAFSGRAKAYAGPAIISAKVSYRIVRALRLPEVWWEWRSPQRITETEIASGAALTNDTGGFSIPFPALADPAIPVEEDPVFTFTVSVDVTDMTGETRSLSGSIDVGYAAISLVLTVPRNVDKDRAPDSVVTITTENCSKTFEPAKGKIIVYRLRPPEKVLRQRLWDAPDTAVMTRKQHDLLFPNDQYDRELEIALWPKTDTVFVGQFDTRQSRGLALPAVTSWKSGVYLLEGRTSDRFGRQVKDSSYFTLFSESDQKPPTPAADWFAPVKDRCGPGEKAMVMIGSGYDKTMVLYEIEQRGEIVQRQWLTLNNSQERVEVPVEEKHRGNFSLIFTFVRNNRSYSHTALITVPWTNKELDISFESFRSKLSPGEKEQWRLRIAGKNKDKVAAEMVAALYDASLDAFRPHSWYFSIWPSYGEAWSWNIRNGFQSLQAHPYNGVWALLPQAPSRTYPVFNWFGYDFEGNWYGVGYGGSYRERVCENKAAAAPMAAPAQPIQLSAIASAPRERETADGRKGVLGIMANKKSQSEEGGKEKAGQEDLSMVASRTNLNETAFFFPQLETDEKGTIVVKFQMPEALTKWKMLGFAHTKDLSYGIVRNELITQKSLMIAPNPPRFFRENDRIVFSAKVSNLSDTDVAGSSQLMLFDAATMKPVDTLFKNTNGRLDFTVQKGKSAPLAWELSVPGGFGAVVVKVVAKAGNYSDGEEQIIPILSNRLLVTESVPLSIRKKETKTFTFEKLVSQNNGSTTLRNHRLTLEFVSNPVWYAVQAMPYLMEYPYECAEQTFGRFYANMIASYLLNSSPRIKTVVDQWRGGSEGALLSNLEKNQELKSLLLEETPWLLDGKDESEQKKRIALLFDINKMADERERALAKLAKQQSESGAWPWFEGMPDDRYITQYVATGIGRLIHLGMISLKEDADIWKMARRAVLYCDDRVREDYEELLRMGAFKPDKNHLGETHVQYLYMRSFFAKVEMEERNKKAFDFFYGQAKKYWPELRRYLQGMVALALMRSNEKTIPMNIIRSLKENALTSEEMGMYWKEMYERPSWWWYEAPIEAQALMIEAFTEIAHDTASVEELKTWLLKSKQTQNWPTTKATAEAIYGLLIRGKSWLAQPSNVEIGLGDVTIDPSHIKDISAEAGTGYVKIAWTGSDIRPAMGNIKVTKREPGVAWGAVYWQYFEQLDKIRPHETPLSISKKLFREQNGAKGPVIAPIEAGASLQRGDRLTVRIELSVDRDMEYVHMKDMRASGFEPLNVLSGYRWQDGLGYYESTRDAATNFFFSYLQKGTYVFEYPLVVSHAGDFSNGITTIQCMYAPEFTSHSEGIRVKVEK